MTPPTQAEIDNVTRLIAECAGFTYCPTASCDFRKVDHWHKNGLIYFNDNISINRLPKFAESLDAISALVLEECERDIDFADKYSDCIAWVMSENEYEYGFQLTAYDWCIAYLKAKGKL